MSALDYWYIKHSTHSINWQKWTHSTSESTPFECPMTARALRRETSIRFVSLSYFDRKRVTQCDLSLCTAYKEFLKHKLTSCLSLPKKLNQSFEISNFSFTFHGEIAGVRGYFIISSVVNNLLTFRQASRYIEDHGVRRSSRLVDTRIQRRGTQCTMCTRVSSFVFVFVLNSCCIFNMFNHDKWRSTQCKYAQVRSHLNSFGY